MTIEELHDLINATPDAKAAAAIGDDEVAAGLAMAVAPKVTKPTFVTFRSIAAACGREPAGRIVQSLKTVADGAVEGVDSATASLIGELLSVLRGIGEPPGLDVGEAQVRGLLDAFAIHPGLPLTLDDAAAIKGMADVTPFISAHMVSEAWAQYRAEGQIPNGVS